MLSSRYLNAVGGTAVIVVNQFANRLPLNGRTTGEIADQFSVIDPVAGFAFSFWFLIYALIIAFCAYQFRDQDTADRLGTPFLASCFFNISWILTWHYGFVALSFTAVLGLVLSLAVGYLRMRTRPLGIGQYLSVNVFFSVYLAWASISAVLAGGVLLEHLGLLRWGEDTVGLLVILIAASVTYAAWVSLGRSDPVFPAAFIWALAATAVRSWDITPVGYSAVAAAIALAVLSLYITVRFTVESRILPPVL